MHLCYIDESGGFEAPNSGGRGVTPVMVFAGVILSGDAVPGFTRDFLALKRKYFPGRCAKGRNLDHILAEVKGAELLAWTRSPSRNKRRQASRIRVDLLDLLEGYDVRLVGRVWVKAPTERLAPTSSYCFAIQDLTRHFNRYLAMAGSIGVVVCDARLPPQNARAAHSVFTDKLRSGGDPVPAVVEAPLFGHSENHAGLQVADLVAGAMLFPMAVHAYCRATATGAHASGRYADVAADIGARLRSRRFVYDGAGRPRGGVTVSDRVGHRPSAALFSP